MAQRPRCFVNRLPDYNGELRLIPVECLHDKCLLLAAQILKMPLRSVHGGLYVGVSGVSYALYQLAQSGHFPADRHRVLCEAKLRVERHIAHASKSSVSAPEDDISFLVGGAGVYVCGALIAAAISDQDGVNTCLSLLADCVHAVVTSPSRDYLATGSDELMVGRAGLLAAIANLRRQLDTPVVSDELVTALCHAVVHSGRHKARLHRAPIPLLLAKTVTNTKLVFQYEYYGVQYLGAAHGLSGVLQMLLCFPTSLRAVDARAETDVQQCVDWLCARQLPNGNWLAAVDELQCDQPKPDREQLVHWCHGAPGIIHLMATAYLLWNQQRYLAAVVRAGDCIWRLGLLTKGAGLCHGIAGNAYAFLLVYRLTGDSKWLHRAHQFLDFLDSEDFQQHASISDHPYSLFEGLAGVLCCHIDLLRPQTAEFPLFPVPGLSLCYT